LKPPDRVIFRRKVLKQLKTDGEEKLPEREYWKSTGDKVDPAARFSFMNELKKKQWVGKTVDRDGDKGWLEYTRKPWKRRPRERRVDHPVLLRRKPVINGGRSGSRHPRSRLRR